MVSSSSANSWPHPKKHARTSAGVGGNQKRAVPVEYVKGLVRRDIRSEIKANIVLVSPLRSCLMLLLALHPGSSFVGTSPLSARASDVHVERLENCKMKAAMHRRCVLHMSVSSIADWIDKFDNSLLRDLRPEDTSKPPTESRKVYGAHYTAVRPTVPAPRPELVVCSHEVANMLGVDPDDEEFVAVFSGGLLPERVTCWATAYTASFGGRNGGEQRGDGRAISIGQVGNLEVQLKGAGTTPYSRNFDGRAVLRSCIREFLASEAMAALGVPTTRALCVVTSGDRVARNWYDWAGQEAVAYEPGAVGTRVAESFLRFGQFELFWHRNEMELLQELAEHALSREFAHLHLQYPNEPLSGLLVHMFAEICEMQGELVAEWLRVGYCQGNMNSDNSAIGGVTLDYGPFAFMEGFDHTYNPWIGGKNLPYAFAEQPRAAQINLQVLCGVFADLLFEVCDSEGIPQDQKEALVQDLYYSVSKRFTAKFDAVRNENFRRKLGLATWDNEAKQLLNELFALMKSSYVDFTLLFRDLVHVPSSVEAEEADDEQLLRFVQHAVFDDVCKWPEESRSDWIEWARRYGERVSKEALEPTERLHMMNSANPKYILRNWMAAEAYEAAERGDYTMVRELHAVLSKPYDEQGEDIDEKWAQPTPQWARKRPGLTFMS